MAKKTIMVVDDEETLRDLMSAILSEEYNVVLASDGKEALEKLKKEKPDLIILDMMMPGMSGREVCSKIRESPKTKSLKIIFLTVAKFSEAGKGTLEKMDVLDYITKPFDNEYLLERIKKYLK